MTRRPGLLSHGVLFWRVSLPPVRLSPPLFLPLPLPPMPYTVPDFRLCPRANTATLRGIFSREKASKKPRPRRPREHSLGGSDSPRAERSAVARDPWAALFRGCQPVSALGSPPARARVRKSKLLTSTAAFVRPRFVLYSPARHRRIVPPPAPRSRLHAYEEPPPPPDAPPFAPLPSRQSPYRGRDAPHLPTVRIHRTEEPCLEYQAPPPRTGRPRSYPFSSPWARRPSPAGSHRPGMFS